MVSFQCEACGDVLTKKKLDPHINRCWNAVFTCIDCMTTFQGAAYKSHTSCMTEAQKYQGALYKDPKNNKSKPAMNGKKPLQPAYVESSAQRQVARVEVPPPAPSPPTSSKQQIISPKPNVFDFLVQDNAEKEGDNEDGQSSPASPSSSSSGASDQEGSLSTAEPSPVRQRTKYREGIDFSYGSGPVEKSTQRFDSQNDLHMTLDDKFGPPLHSAVTPASQRAVKPIEGANQPSTNGKSDKKRKRVEDLDLTVARQDRSSTLHTGLTGGLSKMLMKVNPHEEAEEEASPLSPKKRSKRTKDSKLTRKTEDDEDEVEKHTRALVQKEPRHHKKHRHREQNLLESDRPSLKAIADAPKRQLPHQSHSEFFLGLVDKDHRSSKGQSIWGALKMFHEGVYTDMPVGMYEASGLSEQNQKRLFKGLRMKLNKQGEIVLFSRADKEFDAITN